MRVLPRVSKDHMTQFWCQRAQKRLNPTSLLVVGLRGGVPSEGTGKEVVSPPMVVPNQVRGTYLEVADHRTLLLQEVLRGGLEVHQLSGVVDVARVKPFDDVKVTVKRGEVDWLNIAGWFGRVGTRLIKLCKVALRKGIWWSVHILASADASGCEVERLLQLEGARRVSSSPLGHVITNTPFWSGNTEILLEGVPVSQRSAREHVGGLRNPARAFDRVSGWKLVVHKLSELIEKVVSEFEDELDKVLSGLGQKEQVEHVSEESCEFLRRRLTSCFGLKESDLLPGPGGLVPGIFQNLTAEANDPDVHIHQWLTGKVPVGITAPIELGGVLSIVSPLSVGKEKDRARHLHAKVWGSTNYASYNELKDIADELLKKEVRNGYVQWCANRAELEQEVGTLHLAKIAVVVKGTKVRLIHDLRRNGTNTRVTFWERLMLPRGEGPHHRHHGVAPESGSGEGVELLTLGPI